MSAMTGPVQFLIDQQQSLQQSLLPATSATSATGMAGVPPGADGGGNTNTSRQAHLTKFAFLLSSARSEGGDDPVVGMHHDVEMAACFSRGHLDRQRRQGMGAMGGMIAAPPSISSSSLSISSGKGGDGSSACGGMMAMGGSSAARKAAMLEAAAKNMGAPFYTTPDTVSSTAKTILKNIVTTMEELMESRLRSTVSQLVHKATGGVAYSPLLFRLLSPSREPIQVATVITRFVLPEEDNDENFGGQQRRAASSGDLLSIPLQFKAVLDIKVFGEVSTVELDAPVTMSGKFDLQDGLLTAVDVSFGCDCLLKSMISQARSVVKLAVTKAATLSIQITEWAASKKKAFEVSKPCSANANAASSFSLHSLLGSSVSLSSMGGNSTLSKISNFGSNSAVSGNYNPSFSSLTNSMGSDGLNNLTRQQRISRSLLKESSRSRGLGLNSMSRDGADKDCPNNANATFDFGGGNQGAPAGGNRFYSSNNASVVRFQMPNSTPPLEAPTCGGSEPLPPCLPSHPPPTDQPRQEEELPRKNDNGNIHSGLFAWLQDDKMFLTDEKIQEQNAAEAKRERERLEAPMPLRFFTAADDAGGGQWGLEEVSRSIFGAGQQKRKHGQDHEEQRKRGRIWQ